MPGPKTEVLPGPFSGWSIGLTWFGKRKWQQPRNNPQPRRKVRWGKS
jgi:hypothetical protein